MSRQRKVSSRGQWGTGSVSRIGSRYRVRIPYQGKQRHIGTYDSEEEANAVRVAALQELAKGDWVDPRGQTFREYLPTFLQRRELGGLHNNTETDASRARLHLQDAPFAHKPLASITRAEVQRYINSLAAQEARQTVRTAEGSKTVGAGRTLSGTTIGHVRNLASALFEAAVIDELVDTNPVRGVRAPRTAQTEDAWTFLEADEIDRLLTSDAQDSTARAIYSTAIFTGLRRGELWALDWSDVTLDGERPEIVVRHSHGKATKSGRVRRVPLLPGALVALRSWHAERGTPASGLVFPNAEGGRRRKDDQAGWPDRRQRYKGELQVIPGIKSKAGISRHVRFHDLRHTTASHLLMGTWGRRWSLEEIRVVLGHGSIVTTQRYR